MNFFSFFTKKPVIPAPVEVESPPIMNQADIEKITQYAMSDWSEDKPDNPFREDAIAAYRRNLDQFVGENIYMKFMSQIDTEGPVLSLRALYRENIRRLSK